MDFSWQNKSMVSPWALDCSTYHKLWEPFIITMIYIVINDILTLSSSYALPILQIIATNKLRVAPMSSFVVMEGFQGKEVSSLQHPSFDVDNGVTNVWHCQCAWERWGLIGKRNSIRRFWSNVTFAFLMGKFEKRYWESSKKAMEK